MALFFQLWVFIGMIGAVACHFTLPGGLRGFIEAYMKELHRRDKDPMPEQVLQKIIPVVYVACLIILPLLGPFMFIPVRFK